MDFSFSEEEKLFRKSIRDFCEEKIEPRSREIDEGAKIPPEIIRDMGKAGLLGITVSQRFGGQAANFMQTAIAAEEIARADTSMGTK